MKIVFMGTPDFAIPSLQKLIDVNHEILAVVTAPDKQRGRGKEFSFTPVKEFALKNNLQIFTPGELLDHEFVSQIKKLNGDLFVVVAFRILPKELYTLPKYGSINLHASLLPKYRGAAPIQWSLINGDKETGVTTFFLQDKVDTGNIILQKNIPIEDKDDFGSLHDKLMYIGADVLINTVELIEKENVIVTEQENSLATPAPKITKELCEINWNKSATEIHNLVKGLSPYPGAFFFYKGKIFKVFKTKIQSEVISQGFEWKSISIGLGKKIVHLKVLQTKKNIFIETGSDIIQILELQSEGRKRMTTEEFLRGSSLI
jgi:methionyl-tRNA formyltransferase